VRRTRLGETRSAVNCGRVFEQVVGPVGADGIAHEAMLLGKVAKNLARGEAKSRYAFVVVIEASRTSAFSNCGFVSGTFTT